MVKPELRRGEIPKSASAYREAVNIAAPSVAEMVLISIIGMADTVMVGNLGTYAIAAVGLTNQPRMLMMAIFFAINVGVTAVIARRKGQGRQDEAKLCLRQAVLLNLLLTVLVTGIAMTFASPLMRLAGAKADTIGPATAYFRIIGAGIVFNSLAMTISAALRGVGNTKVTLKINLTANIVNIFLNYLLIEGRFGFPRLEVAGAAVATVLGNFVGLCLAVYAVFKKDCYLRVRLMDSWKPHADMIKSICNVGGNAVLEQVALRIGFFLTQRIVAELGTMDFAVHQICMQMMNLTFTVGDGIGAATTSLVGQNLGRKRPDISIMYGKIGQRMAACISALLFFFIIFGRYWIPSWFSDDPLIIAKAAGILIIMAFIQPVQTSQVIMSGSLRGAGDTKFVAMTMLLTVTVVRPLMSYLCIYPMGLGLTGAWIAIIFDQCIRLFLVSRRFSGGRWIHIKV